MRVLVVEDDDAVAAGILDGLETVNFETHRSSTGAEALDAMSTFGPDIVLLDLGLDDMDGTEVCRRIRETGRIPIIVVSARSEEIDRVVALEIGADDYIVKPFGMRELIARIRAVSRRASPIEEDTEARANNELRFGSLLIDVRARLVTLNDVTVYFTPKEFDLLVYLARDAGAALRRTDILHDVWDTNWYGTTKTLDAHIAAIRKKLGDASWIDSVRGIGFRFGLPR